jgi:hypothetical protein
MVPSRAKPQPEDRGRGAIARANTVKPGDETGEPRSHNWDRMTALAQANRSTRLTMLLPGLRLP